MGRAKVYAVAGTHFEVVRGGSLRDDGFRLRGVPDPAANRTLMGLPGRAQAHSHEWASSV
jgi:hypothetical protein